jgi:hypothetical protein
MAMKVSYGVQNEGLLEWKPRVQQLLPSLAPECPEGGGLKQSPEDKDPRAPGSGPEMDGWLGIWISKVIKKAACP